jgi:hypothetical protein
MQFERPSLLQVKQMLTALATVVSCALKLHVLRGLCVQFEIAILAIFDPVESRSSNCKPPLARPAIFASRDCNTCNLRLQVLQPWAAWGAYAVFVVFHAILLARRCYLR